MTPDLFTLDVLRDYLVVGAGIFALGMLGFLSRRNLIVMFLSAEMMLQGTALTLIAFGRYHGNWSGQVLTILILTLAACEASIALALIVILYNRTSSLDVTLWQEIREPLAAATSPAVVAEEAEPFDAVPGPETYPHLTPAGIEPEHPVQPWIERRF
jgi:NADH-quinone oxidoreductase subunit K